MRNLEMFNQRSKILSFMIMVIFLWQGFLFAGSLDFDINLGVSDLLNTYMQTRDQNSQFKKSYMSSFSADPYGVALSSVKDKGKTLLLGGIGEVSAHLKEKGCSLSQKNISTILYYFDPGFRSTVVSDLSLSKNQYLKKIPSLDDVSKACKSFIQGCYPERRLESNILSKCEEDIVARYRGGFKYQNQLQTVKNSQMGKDKYWNASLEDSPYDILYDIQMISKLFFEEVQNPYQVTFYQMPDFNGGGNGGGGGGGGTPPPGDVILGGEVLWGTDEVLLGIIENDNSRMNSGDTGSVGSRTSEGMDVNVGSIDSKIDGGTAVESVVSSRDGRTSESEINLGYDSEFYDFLEGSKISSFFPTIFGGNICVSPEAVVEDIPDDILFFDDDPLSDVSDEEYEEYIENLINSLDSYFDIPPGTYDSEDGSGNGEPPVNPALGGSSDDFEDQEKVEEMMAAVQTCFTSCNGLPLDKKAACMTKCMCGEWASPWFDPAKFPGLGPIMKIKFCTVPVTAKIFSARGKTVFSIEEIYKELLAILDTMDRSGELGITEEKKSFLDTSAGNTKFSKVITFSIDQSIVKKTKTPVSKSVKEEDNKEENKKLQALLDVIKPLENPVYANAYVLVSSPARTRAANNVAAQNNMTKEIEKQEDLAQTPKQNNDFLKTEKNQRYVALGDEISTFLVQHAYFLDFLFDKTVEITGILEDWKNKPKK